MDMRQTSLCYIIKEGKVLLLYRNKKENDANEGKWIGVGGKLEDGETPEECMKREVHEETGLEVMDYHYHGVILFVSDKWDDEEMHLYSVTGYNGEIKASCDEGRLEWIDIQNVFDLPMWEGDKYFLQPLLGGKDKINMVLRYEGTGEDEHLVEVTEV
jgi:8-oxo-dGTP diphosphatase